MDRSRQPPSKTENIFPVLCTEDDDEASWRAWKDKTFNAETAEIAEKNW